MKYYTKIKYFDSFPEVEIFDNAEDAQDAYAELLDLALDGELGDIAQISFGRMLKNGSFGSMAARDYQ